MSFSSHLTLQEFLAESDELTCEQELNECRKQEKLRSLPLLSFSHFARGASGLLLELVCNGIFPGTPGNCVRALRNGRMDCCSEMTPASVFCAEVVEAEPLHVRFLSCIGTHLWVPAQWQIAGLRQGGEMPMRDDTFMVLADGGGPLIKLYSGGCELGIFAVRRAPPELQESSTCGSPQAIKDRLLLAARRATVSDPELQGRRCHAQDPGHYRSFEEHVLYVHALFYPATVTPAFQDSLGECPSKHADDARRVSMASTTAESIFLEVDREHEEHAADRDEADDSDEESDILGFAKAMWLHATRYESEASNDSEWDLVEFEPFVLQSL